MATVPSGERNSKMTTQGPGNLANKGFKPLEGVFVEGLHVHTHPKFDCRRAFRKVLKTASFLNESRVPASSIVRALL